MKTQIVFAVALSFFSLFSCKKDIVKNQESFVANAQISDDAKGCPNGKWLGSYATPGLPYSYVGDSTFISGGIAQLTHSPWSYFYTGMTLPIPKCHAFSGDSAKVIVRLKNPSDQPLSVAPYDVVLRFYGSKDTAEAYFLAQYPQYTALTVGGIGVTNTPNMIHLFQDWTEVTLEAKNKKLSVYINGVLVEQALYRGAKIGIFKQFNIGLKGAGSIDWVKIYNSYTNEQLMQEDFNIDKQSSVNWY